MVLNVMVRDLPFAQANRDALRSVYLRSLGSRPFGGIADRRLASTLVLSVDAFDTLITRSVLNPADVFLVCAVELRARRLIDATPQVWWASRRHAEALAAKAAFPGEVRIDDIYGRLVSDGLIDRHRVAEAQEVEWKTECALSRPIASTIDAVNAFGARGGRVCVMSDTSMPQISLCQLLMAGGLTLPEHLVFTSSQTGLTKRGGTLFHASLDRLETKARDVLHIGDNLGSDLRRARAAGLAAAPYLHGRSNRLERCLWRGLRGDPLLGSIVTGSARATRLARCFSNPHQQAIWDTSADFSGPLLFSFVVWTLREAVRLGLRRLYFFSRDGEILIKIVRELQPHVAPDVECRYLLASRQSLHLPAIMELGQTEKDWVLDHAAYRSLSGFLARLEIDLATFTSLLPPGSRLHGFVSGGKLGDVGAALLADLLEQEPLQRLILASATPRRRDCLSYMESEKLLDPGQIGVVDIGWRGRLQRSLAKILSTREPGFRDRLHGFYIDLEEPPGDAGAMSVFSQSCGPTTFRWSRRGPLFEILCAAHHGTVRRYRQGAHGHAEAELASPSNPAAERWGLSIQQDAIVAFTREVCAVLRMTDQNPCDHVGLLGPAVLDLTRLFVEYPSRLEADCFGRFTHSEGEEHVNEVEIAGVIDLSPTAFRTRLRATTRYRRISFWPEGSIARSVSPWFRQTALHALRWMPGRGA